MTEKEPDIFQELGLRNPPRFVDHESPRPVDLDVLRAYHRGESDEEDAKDVDYLTSLFRDWHDASNQVLDEISLVEGRKVSNDLVEQTSLNKKAESYWMSRKLVSVLTIAAGVLILVGGLGTYLMKDPSEVVRILDGEKVVKLDNKGHVSGLPDLDEGLLSTVIQVLNGQNIQPLASLPMTPGLKGRGFQSLSTSVLLKPYHTVVSADRPTFRWKGTSKNALTFVVNVYDEFDTIVDQSDTLDQPTWTPTKPLPRGGTYTWDVVVTFDNGTTVLPQGGRHRPAFSILSDVKFAEYENASAQVRESKLALGTFLVREGLLDEAQTEIEFLERQNPESVILRSLSDHIRALRE